MVAEGCPGAYPYALLQGRLFWKYLFQPGHTVQDFLAYCKDLPVMVRLRSPVRSLRKQADAVRVQQKMVSLTLNWKKPRQQAQTSAPTYRTRNENKR